MTGPSSSSRRPSLGSVPATIAMVTVAMSSGVIVGGYLVAFVLMESGSAAAAVILGCFLISVTTLGPAAALWAVRPRLARSAAAGLCGAWLVLVTYLLMVWVNSEQGMSPEAVAQERALIEGTGEPAYYLGERIEGRDLAFVRPHFETGAYGYWFGYGAQCPGDDSGCWADIDVWTLSVARGYLDAYGCTRFPPVLGVPAATTGYALIVFTGDSMVVLSDADDGDNRRGEVVLARQLRPLGQPQAVSSLPPPTPSTMQIIEQVCGSSAR